MGRDGEGVALMGIRLLTVVGTRPEIIKLSKTISEADRFFRQTLVHTGQNFDYELNEIFFKDLGIRRPDYFLDAAGATPAITIGNVISKIDAVIEEINPDAMLLLGDTNSCLSAISAKRRKIPIFHIEAGNRCFDQRVPEEINRKIVDHISDINLVYTEHARRYLIAEGVRPETIIKVGSPMKEVLKSQETTYSDSSVLDVLDLMPNKYFLVSAHREENVDNETNLKSLLESLESLVVKYGYPVIVSTHPRTKNRLDSIENLKHSEQIRFLKPLGFIDYIKLQINATCVISDSGTVTEESSILGFPAVTIRQTHERPEGMDVGTLVMSGLDPIDILNSIEMVISQTFERDVDFKLVNDYDVDNFSQKVVRIIQSYIGYVNRYTWRKTV